MQACGINIEKTNLTAICDVNIKSKKIIKKIDKNVKFFTDPKKC